MANPLNDAERRIEAQQFAIANASKKGSDIFAGKQQAARQELARLEALPGYQRSPRR